MRLVEAGNFASLPTGRVGRSTNSPPQFGHLPPRRFATQSAQNVHSNEHIRASGAPFGKFLSQHSQLGRSSSMAATFVVVVLASIYIAS